MKNLVLHDVRRYLYPGDIRRKVEPYSTTFDGRTFAILDDDVGQSVYYVLGDDIKHIFQITRLEQLISTIFNLCDSQILMVTGTKAIFCNYMTKTTLKFDFDTQILAASACVANLYIALVSKTEVILYSIKADLGRLDRIDSSEYDEEPEDSIFMGWGSTHTQFQRPSSKHVVPVVSNYDAPDWKPELSWRADGNMFAVNMLKNRKRVVKIYDSTCKLLYIADFRGLESMVTFSPITNIVTTIRSTDGLDQIVTMIGSNGEICASFKLRDDRKVVSVKWSLCGTALAVAQQYGKEEEDEYVVCLDIYMESNSEWFCKQRLQFNRSEWRGFEWTNSLKNFYKLKIYLTDGIYDYQFASKIVKCNHPYGSYGISATTYGPRVQFNYFVNDASDDYQKFASTYTIKMGNQISYLVFDSYDYVVAIIDCNYNVKLYNYENRYDWCLLREYTMLSFDEFLPLCIRAIAIEEIYDFEAIVTYSHDPKVLNVKHWYELQKKTYLHPKGSQLVPDSIFSLSHTINDKVRNECVEFDHIDNALPIIDAFAFRTDKGIVKVTLNSADQLFIKGVDLKLIVTSMVYDAKNLIITTTNEKCSDYLMAIKLNDGNIQRLMDGVDPFSFAYNRSIPQGAICMNLMHNSPTALLSMPSGSSELIEVRSITIDILSELINDLKYKSAFKLINHYGLAIKMLVDVNPQKFIDNVDHVYGELKDFDVFTKIVMDLRVSSHQYKDGVYVFNFPDIKNKMEKVCEALIARCCQEMPINTNAEAVTLMCLFSTYPTLNVLKAIEFVSSYVCSTDISCAEDPINALFAYVSYENLVSIALSVYNLDLAELIVNMSQLDFGNYLTFINSLRTMERNAQRFAICKFLHNYKLATYYLCEIYENSLEEFSDKAEEDLLTYAKQNGTIQTAYQILDASGKCMLVLAVMYARELHVREQHLEAGMVLYRHKLFNKASQLFLRGQHFDEALSAIKAMPVEQGQKILKVRRLAEIVFKAGKHEKAAHIYLTDLKDMDSAVTCFLEARQYMTVYNLALRISRGKSIISTRIIPSMLKYCEKLTETLSIDKNLFESDYNRLIQLQKDHKHEANNKKYIVLHPDEPATNEAVLYADAEPVSPVWNATSERFCGGGPYEDIQIIARMHDMAVKVFSMQPEIKDLFSAFYCIMPSQHDQHLNEINLHLIEYQKFVISHAENIWRKEYTDVTAVAEALDVCPNLHLLDPKYRYAPSMEIVWESSVAVEAVDDKFF